MEIIARGQSAGKWYNWDMRIFCFIVMVFSLCSSVTRAEVEQPADTPQVSTNEISLWVAELDSNLFDDRERAQKHLIKAGPAALEAVGKLARDGSLESSTRAINILLAWSEAEDHQLVLAALEYLAALDNHPKQATQAKELLADVRENLALEEIKKLGGLYQPVQLANGIILPRQLRNVQIFIGLEWKGGIEGLKHLEKVTSAAVVSFHSPPLGDEALPILERLPQLKRVELFGTKQMTKGAIEELKVKLVGVDFDERSGAFLGVRGTFGDYAQVGEVVPGSAADVAGIKPKDVITHFEGQEVKDFVTLTRLIGQHEPGDTVSLNVMRPQENGPPQAIEVKVTFAQWGKNGAGAQVPLNVNQLPNSIIQQEPGKLKLDRR
jgi:hypothetical protein